MNDSIHLIVNGLTVRFRPQAGLTLMAYLRDDMGLTGVKNGCSVGACGTCTVIMNGSAVRSCRVPVEKADGAVIETIEHLADSQTLHPLQYAFIAEGAVQCGFCTPGMILAAKSLLDSKLTASDPVSASVSESSATSVPQKKRKAQQNGRTRSEEDEGLLSLSSISVSSFTSAPPDHAGQTFTEQEIRTALNANLCRCTGYQPILRAVLLADALISSGVDRVPISEAHALLEDRKTNRKGRRTDALNDGGPVSRDRRAAGAERAEERVCQGRRKGAVGSDVRDFSIVEKVTGAMQYGADRPHSSDILHGCMIFSSHPSARFDLGTAHAERMDGVRLILTAKDVPGINRMGMIIDDQPVFADGIVKSIADPIAAIFAETEKQARAAAAAVSITYTSLPGVYSPQEALAPLAPAVHPDGNICHQAAIRRGDAAAAASRAAVIVEDIFVTQPVDPGFLEPESGIAWIDDQGRVVVEIGTQSAFDDRRQLAVVLDIPEEKIIVKQLPTGGAFGAKEDIILQAALALAALKTGKPVRITLAREQSFKVHPKRHPVTMSYKIAADSNGSLLSVEADIVADTGAYASLGPDILENMLTFGAGPYEVPHIDIRGRLVYTNNPPHGAMRGFGVPQVAFAVEQLMERIALQLGIHPLRLRRINALSPGRYLASGHRMPEGTAVVETIDALNRLLLQDRDLTLEDRPEGFSHQYFSDAARAEKQAEWAYGIGYSAAMKNVGFGHGILEEAGARIEITAEGLLMRCGTFEYGQGSITVLRQLAVETFGADIAQVKLDLTETEHSPATGATTASRQTFLSGNAVVGASRALRDRVAARAAELYGGSTSSWEIFDAQVLNIQTGRTLSLFAPTFVGMHAEYRYAAPATEGFRKNADVPGHAAGTAGAVGLYPSPLDTSPTHWAYACTAQAALVRVNRYDGRIEVLTIWAAQDCGKALNPLNVRSQIVGGVVQGMGYALSEEIDYEEGRQKTDNFHRYHMPRIRQIPRIVPEIVEVPDPNGPYGAKGMGEVPLLGTAPAIANAVHDAVKRWYTRLPLPKKIESGDYQ